MSNYDEKIAKIKETHKYLIEEVKKEIEEKNNILNLNIGDLTSLLDYDSTMVKKYEAVVRAQELIDEFTTSIKNSNSVEEIKAIRNKLNYYINKIKKEIKDRGLSEEEFNRYYMNATNLRKGIAKYVRFLKRDEKISEIEALNGNIENLDKEELTRLRTLLKNEVAYGKKYTELYANPVVEEPVKVEPKTLTLEDLKREQQEKANRTQNSFANSKVLEEIRNTPVVVPSAKTPIKAKLDIPTAAPKADPEDFKRYETLEDYLGDKINAFKTHYRLVRTEKYTNSVIKNIPILVRNVPRIIENKKKIRNIVKDMRFYYSTPELIAFGRYTIRKNSFMHNIKEVFRKSFLRNREAMYVAEHNRCIEWVKNFCNKNRMEIRYEKTI